MLFHFTLLSIRNYSPARTLIDEMILGSMAFSSGQYSWQVSVTSYGARRILIGVSSTCPDQYRNSTSIGR